MHSALAPANTVSTCLPRASAVVAGTPVFIAATAAGPIFSRNSGWPPTRSLRSVLTWSERSLIVFVHPSRSYTTLCSAILSSFLSVMVARFSRPATSCWASPTANSNAPKKSPRAAFSFSSLAYWIMAA